MRSNLTRPKRDRDSAEWQAVTRAAIWARVTGDARDGMRQDVPTLSGGSYVSALTGDRVRVMRGSVPVPPCA